MATTAEAPQLRQRGDGDGNTASPSTTRHPENKQADSRNKDIGTGTADDPISVNEFVKFAQDPKRQDPQADEVAELLAGKYYWTVTSRGRHKHIYCNYRELFVPTVNPDGTDDDLFAVWFDDEHNDYPTTTTTGRQHHQ